MTVPRSDRIPLPEFLDRLGEEAGSLAFTTARAEAALQSVLQSLGGRLPPGVAGDLQQIDLVRQSLEDFSRLLWIAAAAAPGEHGPSLGSVQGAATLAGLAARMMEGHAIEPKEIDPADDLVLF